MTAKAMLGRTVIIYGIAISVAKRRNTMSKLRKFAGYVAIVLRFNDVICYGRWFA